MLFLGSPTADPIPKGNIPVFNLTPHLDGHLFIGPWISRDIRASTANGNWPLERMKSQSVFRSQPTRRRVNSRSQERFLQPL